LREANSASVIGNGFRLSSLAAAGSGEGVHGALAAPLHAQLDARYDQVIADPIRITETPAPPIKQDARGSWPGFRRWLAIILAQDRCRAAPCARSPVSVRP
jgi:hypothetical protein